MIERARNIYWDSICHFWKCNPQTKAEQFRVGKLSRDFKIKEPDPVKFPEILHLKIKQYQKTYPGIACTPEAVAKHWDFLQGPAKTEVFKPDKVEDSELPQDEDWDEIKEMMRKKGLT